MTWLAGALTASYVGILYLRPKTRPSAIVQRDDRNVLIERLWVISSLSVAVCIGFTYYGYDLGLQLSIDALQWTLKSILLTMVLFAAPLYDHLTQFESVSTAIVALVTDNWSLYGLRNYVVGPITEELVFRAALLASLDGWSFNWLVFGSPLFFGVAHLHHAHEELLVYGLDQWVPIVLTSLFQLAFTTVFGWYASYLYLHTGTIYVPIGVHIFCNLMGPPTGDARVVYRVLLVLGLIGFILAIRAF